MPVISISEDDFRTIACAAMDAKEKGDMEAARKLDKIARKINATLSSNSFTSPFGKLSKAMSWRDCPSTIGEN